MRTHASDNGEPEGIVMLSFVSIFVTLTSAYNVSWECFRVGCLHIRKAAVVINNESNAKKRRS